jgi:hypothetical protein
MTRLLGAIVLLAAGVAAAVEPNTALLQSPGVNQPADIDVWRSQENRGGLRPYPAAPPGAPNPGEALFLFGGSGTTSFATPDLGMPFSEWRQRMEQQRPQVDQAARQRLQAHYDLQCRPHPDATMSRGKPQPLGPSARLPPGVDSWEAYAALPADEIRRRGAFPWLPLEHPLHSTAHMLFPRQWTTTHPEHERLDAGFDIPDSFLPEFPPALYLTTHLELGDVSRGVEITYANSFKLFDGDTAMLAAIGGRDLQKAQTNHVGDFNAIIDFPPAPKLDALNRLIPEKATPAELPGEALFLGKAQCAACHPPASHFTDNTMHDLKVERFYAGRPEGPIKTFPLRGIKDSPPYLHDGRLLTLEDAVLFFDVVLSTRLAAAEKQDLAAYPRSL